VLKSAVAFCDIFTSHISRDATSLYENSKSKPPSFTGLGSLVEEESAALVRIFLEREWAVDAIEHKGEEGGHGAVVVALQVDTLKSLLVHAFAFSPTQTTSSQSCLAHL
jgi:hypothetical protein